jgi:hypothetical protein
MSDSYQEAVEKAQAAIGRARLADPDDHFPYRHATVRALLDADVPLGPAGPDDRRVTAADVTSPRIADASQAYVEAQAAYLAAPDRGTRSALDAAGDDLIAARRSHRRNRTGPDGKPVGAILAIADSPPAGLVHGIRAKRIGED